MIATSERGVDEFPFGTPMPVHGSADPHGFSEKYIFPRGYLLMETVHSSNRQWASFGYAAAACLHCCDDRRQLLLVERLAGQ